MCQAVGAFFKITDEIKSAAIRLVAGFNPACLDHVLEEVRCLEQGSSRFGSDRKRLDLNSRGVFHAALSRIIGWRLLTVLLGRLGLAGRGLSSLLSL